MTLNAIKNVADYQEALRQIEELMSARAGTPEGDRLDALATLIEEYEREVFPLEEADTVEVARFYIDQNTRIQRADSKEVHSMFRSGKAAI